jgi:kumamolisin
MVLTRKFIQIFRCEEAQMKAAVFELSALASLFTIPALIAQPQPAIQVPSTSVERLDDRGLRAHTNHLILLLPDFTGTSPSGETPASIRAVYKLPSTGGAGTIAIVDAFHYPTAERDLGVFSSTFKLPSCTKANGCFRQVFASGTQPRTSCGWAQEAALDIEWAHAMAPKAKIILVEAASNSFADLFHAVDVATSQVTTGGRKGEVSMSWGGGEFSSETSFDPHFQNLGVVYFAASGDTGGVNIYPSTSPHVVSSGGTTLHRSSSGAFLSESGWSGFNAEGLGRKVRGGARKRCSRAAEGC